MIAAAGVAAAELRAEVAERERLADRHRRERTVSPINGKPPPITVEHFSI
jgi:hypothetical protein